MNYSNYSKAVLAAKKGKQDAYTYLYNATYQSAYYTAFRVMNNEEDAYDVVQKAYIKAFNSLDLLDNAETFPKWIKVICTRTAIDEKRKRKELLFTEMESDDENGLNFEESIEEVRQDVQPELSLDQKETQRLIQEIIGNLSDEQRFCINMFYMEQRSVKEIAEMLGVAENTVKSRLFLGRKKIEEKVLELERKGTKLYGLAPIPFLVWLFRTAEKTEIIPSAITVSATADSVIGIGTGSTANVGIKVVGTAAKVLSGKLIAGIATGIVVVASVTTVSVVSIERSRKSAASIESELGGQTENQIVESQTDLTEMEMISSEFYEETQIAEEPDADETAENADDDADGNENVNNNSNNRTNYREIGTAWAESLGYTNLGVLVWDDASHAHAYVLCAGPLFRIDDNRVYEDFCANAVGPGSCHGEETHIETTVIDGYEYDILDCHYWIEYP